MPRITGHLQQRRNWRTWDFSFLIIHPILGIWPRWNNNCSLDWKTIESSQFFVRRGRYSRRGDLVETDILIFFEWFVKVRVTGWEVYWASWEVCCINPEFGRCSLFPSWSG
jgi:hypothetical protein